MVLYLCNLSAFAASFGSELTQPRIELILVIGNINWEWSRVKIPELTLSCPGLILTESSRPSIWLIVENSRFFIAFSWNEAESLTLSPRKFKIQVPFSHPLLWGTEGQIGNDRRLRTAHEEFRPNDHRCTLSCQHGAFGFENFLLLNLI